MVHDLIPMLTKREVADLLHVHVNTVSRISPEDLPYIRINHRGDRRYQIEDLNAFIKRMTHER